MGGMLEGNLRKQQNWEGAPGHAWFSTLLFLGVCKATGLYIGSLKWSWSCISGRLTIILCMGCGRWLLTTVCDIQGKAGCYDSFLCRSLEPGAPLKPQHSVLWDWAAPHWHGINGTRPGMAGKSKHSWQTQNKCKSKWLAFQEVALNFKRQFSERICSTKALSRNVEVVAH